MVPVKQALSASETGMFRCLRQLAEEAATLNMPNTLVAIERAVAAAADESTCIRNDPHAAIH